MSLYDTHSTEHRAAAAANGAKHGVKPAARCLHVTPFMEGVSVTRSSVRCTKGGSALLTLAYQPATIRLRSGFILKVPQRS